MFNIISYNGMQIKTTIRYNDTENKFTIPSADKNMEQLELSSFAGRI